MKKWQIIAIIVTAIAIVIILANTSFHWTKANENSQFSSQCGTTFDEDSRILQTANVIGVVTPLVDKELRYFQHEIAQKICDHLSKASIVYNAVRSESYSASCPTVHIYTTRIEAAKKGAQFLVLVKPKMWEYSWNPISRNWSAKVEFIGGPTEALKTTPMCIGPKYGPYDWFSTSSEYSGQGKMTGLFSTAYLTSVVADSAAKSFSKQLIKSLKDSVDDYTHKR